MSDFEKHLAEPGLDWEQSLSDLLRGSERRAWRVATGALISSALSLLALIMVLPLKQAIPYLISVDRATGQNEIISLAANQSMPLRAVESKALLASYVRTRERIARTSIRDDFASIIRWSDKTEGERYADSIKRLIAAENTNKAAPETRIEIISIGLVDDTHAVVRFKRIPLASATAPAAASSSGTATLTFSIKPPLSGREADLIANPLGFKVQTYHVDPDLIDQGASQ